MISALGDVFHPLTHIKVGLMSHFSASCRDEAAVGGFKSQNKMRLSVTQADFEVTYDGAFGKTLSRV